MPDKEGADTDGARESECSGAESGREQKPVSRDSSFSLSGSQLSHVCNVHPRVGEVFVKTKLVRGVSTWC